MIAGLPQISFCNGVPFCLQHKIRNSFWRFQRRKKYTPPPWRPSLFSFAGSEVLWCIPFFPDLWCIPFPLFSQENGIHHSFFFSVTSGSGNRPRKEGSHGGGVYSFFPWISPPPPQAKPNPEHQLRRNSQSPKGPSRTKNTTG